MTEPKKQPSIDDLSAPTSDSKSTSDAGIDAISAGSTEPTFGEKATEVGIGAAQGAVEMGPTWMGGVQGARIGLQAGTTFPVFGPATPAIGGALGLGTGLAIGYLSGQQLSSLFPGVEKEQLVPYREGGKTFGSSIAVAPSAFYMPLMTGNRVSRFVSGIGEFARKNPKTFVTAETAGASGAGVGGGVAEAYDPGDAGTRFGAELVGGLFNPQRTIINVGSSVKDTAKNLASRFSPAARESIAANRLVNILNEYGEDIPKLIQQLEKQSLVSGQTAAQKTGSVPLTLLEKSLADSSAKFGVSTAERGSQAMKAYSLLIKNLENIGDPQALREAAKIRQKFFDDLLTQRLHLADVDAATKISKISKDTAASRVEIGEITKKEVFNALKDARAHEADLWKNIANSKELVAPSNTLQAYEQIKSLVTPEQIKFRFPPEIKATLKRIEDTKGTMTAGELIKARRSFLSYSREAAARDESMNAEFLGRLERAILDDLDAVQTTDSAYNAAREFSRTLNQKFTQTFAQDVTGRTKTGAARVPPEILVSKAFTSGADMTALRLAEIEDSVNFFPKLYDDAAKKFGPNSPQALRLKPFADDAAQGSVSIRDAQDRMLRLAAAESIDPQTGALNTKRLAKFVADNEIMLAKFPDLANDLKDATKAQNAFRSLQDQNSVVAKKIQNQTAFAKLLEYENPSDAISAAVMSKNPAQNFGRIVRLAERGGPDAVAGLKSAVYDYAYMKAGGDKNFKLGDYYDALFKPVGQGKPSLATLMSRQGVIDFGEARNMGRILREMDRVETALINRKSLDEALDASDIVTEFVLRTTGARLGAAASAGPSTLVAASAGSKLVRNMFDKMPKFMIRQILEEASENPQMMAELLKKGKNVQEKATIARSLHGYLAAAGLNYFSPDEESVVQKKPASAVDTGPTARQMLQNLQPPELRKPQPAAPSTRSTATQAKPGAPVKSQAPAAGQNNAASMFQALFPNDTLGNIIQQQKQPQ
jgi:hypothetical protein